MALKQFYIINAGPAKIQRVQQKIPGSWTYVQQNENKFQKVCSIETKQAPSDADLLIATTAVQSSITRPTIILGEDTDLLILLLYYYECGSMQLIFRPNHDSEVKDLGHWQNYLYSWTRNIQSHISYTCNKWV